MNLDKRIKNGKTYLDCFDIEKAKNFIGKKCYMADKPSLFSNLDDISIATLTSVAGYTGNAQPYTLSTIHSTYDVGLILPCEWVKEPEYRPYTKEEFLTLFDLGKFHSIRVMGEPYSRVVITSVYYADGIFYIRVAGDNSAYNIMWLFKHCEYLDGEDWKPFGIKE